MDSLCGTEIGRPKGLLTLPPAPVQRCERTLPVLSTCLQQLVEAEAKLGSVRKTLIQAMAADGISFNGLGSDILMYAKDRAVSAQPSPNAGVAAFSSENPRVGPRDLEQTPPPAPSGEAEAATPTLDQAQPKGTDGEGKSRMRQFTQQDLITGEAFASQEETLSALQLAKDMDLSEEELLKCRSVFVDGDKDKSGTIDIVELKPMLEAATGIIMEDKDYRGVMRKFDDNHDGALNFSEFVHAYCATPDKESDVLKAKLSMHGEKIDKHHADANMSPDERVARDGVKQSIVVWYLRQELAEKAACFQIPMMFALLLIWFTAVNFHTRWGEVQAAAYAIEFDITENANFAFSGSAPFDNGRMGHKGVDDVNTFADFWSWFNLGLVPLFWPEGWDVSEMRTNMATSCMSPKKALENAGWPTESLHGLHDDALLPQACPNMTDAPPSSGGWPAAQPTYLFYHTVIGGVRLSQEVIGDLTCNADRSIKHVTECQETSGNFLHPSLHNFFATNQELVNLPGAETQYLNSNLNRTSILRKSRALEDHGWLNPRTAVLEILFTTYNPHMDMFIGTFIRFYLNRAGHFFKVIEPACHWTYPFHGWWCYAADLVWLLLVLKLFVDDITLLVLHWKELGVHRGTLLYMSHLGNLICWLSGLLSLVLIYQGQAYLFELSELREYIGRSNPKIPGSFETEEELVSYYALVSEMSTRVYTLRMLLAGYPFVIGVRLFRSFDAQPRLGLVTKTLQKASTEIIHFGVVFFSAFLIYSAAGMVLFGSDLESFSTLSRAMTSVFLVLIGDFDWAEMQTVGLPMAMAWFWSFIIFVNLIMLNMLLAIVMDVYTDVKSDLPASAPTMWSQVALIHRRWRELRAGGRVSLRVILKALDPTELDTKKYRKEQNPRLLTKEALVAEVPGLPEDQAQRLLVNAMHEWNELDKPPSAISDSFDKILELDKKVTAVHQHVMHVDQNHRLAACLTASTSRDILKQLQTFKQAFPGPDQNVDGKKTNSCW